ncbi:hypothetical protein TorRG33x02_287250 [Trema orientale]|uniref:Uncharacterized protein n=1 Tax=Trema orientale TaxID=63057 RepID=A0A2P5CF22_TREOI|nr:hypothetical protein TorRG33x02_287250 [Trema orientale]
MWEFNRYDWFQLELLQLEWQENMKPLSFVVPDSELLCITAENGYRKKVLVMNKNVRSTSSSTCSLLMKMRTYFSGRRKTNNNPVKGQWTVEEDG